MESFDGIDGHARYQWIPYQYIRAIVIFYNIYSSWNDDDAADDDAIVIFYNIYSSWNDDDAADDDDAFVMLWPYKILSKMLSKMLSRLSSALSIHILFLNIYSISVTCFKHTNQHIFY